jgi:hypothetical protein
VCVRAQGGVRAPRHNARCVSPCPPAPASTRSSCVTISCTSYSSSRLPPASGKCTLVAARAAVSGCRQEHAQPDAKLSALTCRLLAPRVSAARGPPAAPQATQRSDGTRPAAGGGWGLCQSCAARLVVVCVCVCACRGAVCAWHTGWQGSVCRRDMLVNQVQLDARLHTPMCLVSTPTPHRNSPCCTVVHLPPSVLPCSSRVTLLKRPDCASLAAVTRPPMPPPTTTQALPLLLAGVATQRRLWWRLAARVLHERAHCVGRPCACSMLCV